MELLGARCPVISAHWCADDGAVMVSALPLAFFVILVDTLLGPDPPKGPRAHAPDN